MMEVVPAYKYTAKDDTLLWYYCFAELTGKCTTISAIFVVNLFGIFKMPV